MNTVISLSISLLIWISFVPLHYTEAQYSSFQSIEEVINDESSKISQISPLEHESLCDAYLSRGESYLLSEKYDLALADMHEAYKIGLLCNEQDKASILLRSLLGQAFAYGIMNKIDELHDSLEFINSLLSFYECEACRERYLAMTFAPNNNNFDITRVADQPILGPDEISMQECVERAETVAKLSKALSIRAKKEIRYILNTAIDGLERSAIRCCRAGGLWKGCLKGLVNKWHQWNEKWTVFRIPPDPAWDD